MSAVSTLCSPATVLIVDDDEFALESMRAALTPMLPGAVATAVDGLAALRLLQASPRQPDVLICDVYMPHMDGLEFLDQLAQMQFKGGVLMVSGQSIEMLDVACQIATGLGLRVLASFAKPVSQTQLWTAMGLAASD